MRFSKLRLLGFKSFVEPTEFVIERGLTGVVGPNGCGKSNLVEALRWVMGENSYKNMRASAWTMSFFPGSGKRPARNTAEVTLFLENNDHTAPAAFNDADELGGFAAGSNAKPVPPIASMARKPVRKTCNCCSPINPPAPARHPWWDKGALAN